MSACSSVPQTPDSSSSFRSFDAFQRRNIGSIRDNTKLFKILQQFESACHEEGKLSDLLPKDRNVLSSRSTPYSFTNKTSTEEFFRIGPSAKTKASLSDGDIKLISASGVRRHSEGEAVENRSISHLTSQSKYKPFLKNGSTFVDFKRFKSPANTDFKYRSPLINRKRDSNYPTVATNVKTTSKKPVTPESDNYNRLRFASVKNPVVPSIIPNSDTGDTSVRETLCRSNKDILSSPVIKTSTKIHAKNDSFKLNDKAEDTTPPPIPKRGMSAPASHIMQNSEVPRKNKLSPPPSLRTPPSPRNCIKQDSVKKAIQLYEGLSSSNFKTSKIFKKPSNYPKVVLRKESGVSDNREQNIRKVTVSRKSSKRNSFKSSKNDTSLKEELKKGNVISSKNERTDGVTFSQPKEDSGIGFSDSEENRTSQGIYQTLGCANHVVDQCDTYDRLNRIHDMVNRIHKGQSSTCAACKAIPISSFQLPTAAGPSILHVTCNELAPHHHPPCICFSCQHSVFSCSQGTSSPSLDLSLEPLSIDDHDSLYYNVCCLNGPTCEGWRQSRRRPVCEKNGRLCVVNCDMERRNESAQSYEKLFECNTVFRQDGALVKQSSKHPSGDSYDSDEGWVDVTDSEDEKLLSIHDSSSSFSKTKDCDILNTSLKRLLTREGSETLSVQNASYDTQPNGIYAKVGNENSISRTSSSEHLYETIGDLEAHNINKSSSSTIADDVQAKNDASADNDPDSGEWSTESSSSPTPGETPIHLTVEEKRSNTSETSTSRFTVASDLEYQDVGSKRFIKILGKKTVSPKKRRMSNFFVPWLVSNHEYGSSKSPKSTMKKQASRSVKVDSSPIKASKTFTKNKRSQSIPSCATETKLSCTKIFSSTEILDRCKSDMRELEHNSHNYPESTNSLSVSSIDSLPQSRGSLASSTYIRADQLHTTKVKSKHVSVDAATDVSVEKVFRRSSSGDSVHSYIVFRPIKEEEVPLYQFYERNMKERVALCRSPDHFSQAMSSGLDASLSHDCSSQHKTSLVRPQLSVIEQLSPDAKDIKMLWCELPEVKDSGILEKISAQELKLQEAAFEFIQSQASYIRSLKVLYEHFICVPEFSDVQSSYCVLSKHEHDVLFSDIIGVKAVSERLMAELTARWSDCILIPDICDIIYRLATMPSFSVYIKYCSNRVYQEKTLKELKETRLCFLEVLRKLESNPACQGLSLESFLFLPMQHIARLPLLLDNIFRWLGPDSPSFTNCKLALEAVHKTFMECNDGARKMERLEEMFILYKQLEFKDCKVIPLISASRWLLKRGELVKLEFDKKTFGRSSRCVRIPLYIFLFNDLVVITKRKSDDSYVVIDYCLRDKMQATAVDAKDLPQPYLVPANFHYLLSLNLFNNHQCNSVELILNCALLSERTRWLEAIHPVSQKKTPEVWEYDCPQVQCVRSYIAQQPDELSLQESDVVTIHRKMNDGWYEGRRLRDGLQGWFPASYTMDIPCSRARASNLRQCYRLLMLSQKHEAKQ